MIHSGKIHDSLPNPNIQTTKTLKRLHGKKRKAAFKAAFNMRHFFKT
jgi:hypothetical protein